MYRNEDKIVVMKPW